MMRKSMWLLSAGLSRFQRRHLPRQRNRPPTPTSRRPSRPTARPKARRSTTRRANSSRSTPATSSSPRPAATRRCPTFRSRSPRSPRETLQNTGASDIRQLNQVSPSLLVSSTSSEAGAAVARIRGIGTVGDNPGLESSVARVHRRRLSLAHRRRPDRTRRRSTASKCCAGRRARCSAATPRPA